MSSYGDMVRKHRRLAILRHLEEVSEYTANASILTDVLRGVGVGGTRDQVVTEIVWLRDQGFVTADDHEDFVIVTATHRGLEIARGETSHPDIQRPRPRG